MATYDCHDDGKEATTRIVPLARTASDTIVLCEPKHGRTHQIRLHLQWIGHPIVDDPLYGPASESFRKLFPDRSQSAGASKGEGEGEGEGEDGTSPPAKKVRSGAAEDPELNLATRGWLDDGCVVCQQAVATDARGYFINVKRNEDDAEAMGICLHALSYAADGWEYHADLPPWADPHTVPDLSDFTPALTALGWTRPTGAAIPTAMAAPEVATGAMAEADVADNDKAEPAQ
mmetsp:Transcript_63239/g.149872  ORF Transcript_63239/g.149872 Transcript_63239/m.149872 type:complete len:232 (+) Transcript_63239:187-882(+)